MKVFTVNFEGHYPVGTAMLVVAPDVYTAHALAVKKLREAGLWLDEWRAGAKNYPKTFTLDSLDEVDLNTAHAEMLTDGNY